MHGKRSWERIIQKAVLLAVALTVAPVGLMGQADVATLRVRVREQSGGVVPGARVVVTETRLNRSVSGTSSEEGLATFVQLRPGTYDVRVEQQGFRTVQITGVEMNVDQIRSVAAVLQVAPVSEQVEVMAYGAPIQTEQASLGEVIGNDIATQLPLAGRRFDDLIALVPGSWQSASSGLSTRGYGYFSVNGNYASQNNFMLDGLDNNQGTTNLQTRNVMVVRPAPDAIAEFKIQTNSYSAQFGRAGGAVINTSLKSGTNEVHGAGWWFNRHEALAANSWLGNNTGAVKPPLRWNQFGGAAGGAIVKSKLFYFGDYQGFRLTNPAQFVTSVPTAEMKGGVFPLTVRDPATGAPFPNNTIPASQFDPLGKKVLDLYPNPTTAGVVTGGRQLQNYAKRRDNDQHTDQFDVRIDYYQSDSSRFFGRYSYNRDLAALAQIFEGPADGADDGNYYTLNQSFGIGWTKTVSPAAVNEFRFGHNRQNGSFESVTNLNGPTGTEFGFKGIPADQQSIRGLPRIDMTIYNDLGLRNYRPQFQRPTQFQFLDTLSLVRGRHTLVLGGEFRWKSNPFQDIQRAVPYYRFRGTYTQDEIADLALGLPDRYVVSTRPTVDQRQQAYAIFAQYDLKATQRLSLNLGMRYEYTTPLYGAGEFGNVNFDYAVGQLVVAPQVDPGRFGVRGADKYLVDRDFNNFAPRMGVAFQLVPDKIVLRAGYGIFYSSEDYFGSEGNLLVNPPNLFAVTVDGSRTKPAIQFSDALPAGTLDPAKLSSSNLALKSRAKNLVSPLVHQWNVAMEFLLPGNSSFEMAYVGNRGASLQSLDTRNTTPFGVNFTVAANRPHPNWNAIQILDTNGDSWYDALQLKFRKQMGRSLYLLGTYTYASAIQTSGSFTSGQILAQVPGQLQRQPNYESPRQIATITSLFNLPVGRGMAFGNDMPKALDAIIGGWQLSPIITIRSGLPVFGFMLEAGTDPLTGKVYSFTQRGGGYLQPDRVGNPNAHSDADQDRLHFLDINAYRVQEIDTPGNGIIASSRGSGFVNVTLGINKNFKIRENQKLEFRWEMFNALNQTNWAQPYSLYGSPLFGAILGARDNRQIQIGLRYQF